MNTNKRSSKAEIEDLIRARYSLIWITSPEEDRVEEALKRLCVEREMRLEVWSITEGFKTLANGQGTRDVKDPMKAIDHVIRSEGRGLFVLRDFHPFLKEPAVVRRLRDAAHELRKTKKSLAVLSPVTKVPPELEKSISAILDWELPNRQEIEAAAKKVLPSLPQPTQQVIESDPTFMERVVEAALGLTLVEAENVFAKSAVRTQTFDLETILEREEADHPQERAARVLRASRRVLRRRRHGRCSRIGWSKRRSAFGTRARDFGLPLPKGILLIGVPGCGKSLTAKAVGALWQMPLLAPRRRQDLRRPRRRVAKRTCARRSRLRRRSRRRSCGSTRSRKASRARGRRASTDGGTTSRVFGTFITWLQEKTTPVFVIATANNVHAAAARAAAQGPLRRDLLRRSAGSRGAPDRSSTFTSARRSRDRRPVRYRTSWSMRRPTSRAPSSSRRWSLRSTTPSIAAMTSTPKGCSRPSARSCRSRSRCARGSTRCASGRAPARAWRRHAAASLLRRKAGWPAMAHRPRTSATKVPKGQTMASGS